MSWAAAADDRLERTRPRATGGVPTRTGTRWRPRRGSATPPCPACGTRTVASASATTSCGQPVRLVAEHERDRARRDPTGTGPRSPSAVHREHLRSPLSRDGLRSPSAVSSPRTTGRWKIEPADERTVFGLYDVDRAGGEHHAVGAGGVGRAQHRAGVPGIAHLVQDRDAPVDGQRVEPDVEERRHAHDPLRGHRRRQLAHHVVADRVDLDARLPSPHGQRIEFVDDEQRHAGRPDAPRPRRRPGHPPPGSDRSSSRKARFFSRTAAATFGFLMDVSTGLSPTSRCPRSTASRPPSACGGERRLRGLDQRGERRGVVHRQVREDLAIDLDAGGLQPVDEPRVRRGRADGPPALMRVIHSRRNCALRSRRSRYA